MPASMPEIAPMQNFAPGTPGAPMQSANPSLVYTVKHQGQGDAERVDNAHVMQELGRMGYNPQNMSPDGQTVTLVDANGPYEVPVQKALENLGYQVSEISVMPEASNFDGISAQLRLGVAKMPNDIMRQQYLEQHLREQGIPNPKVVGSGRDWHMYDPETSKYKALTNTPEWDGYDAAEAAIELPRVLGGALGGVGAGLLGLPSGPGAIAAAAAGVGAGGAAADTAVRALLAGIDPAYKTISEENLGAHGKDIGINAAIDTATMGLLKGGGQVLSKMGPVGGAANQVINQGVVSPVVRGFGATAEAVGGGVAKAARGMQTPFGRSVVSMGTGTGELEAAGWLAGVPQWAAKKFPGAAQKVAGWGESAANKINRVAGAPRGEFIGPHPGITGQVGQKFAGARESIKSMAEESVPKPTFMQNYGSRMSVGGGAPAPASPSASNIGGAIGRKTGEAIERKLAAPRGGNIGPNKPGNYASTMETFGRGAGEVADIAASVGRGAQNVAQATAGTALGGAELGGRLVQGAGKGLKTIGGFTSPLESRYAAQRGTDWAQDEIERLRRQRLQSRMSPREIFASSN